MNPLLWLWKPVTAQTIEINSVEINPARMVKAMLVGNKNDANDAVAIVEAA